MSDQIPPPPPPPPPGPASAGPGATPWQGPPLAEWPQRAIAGLIDYIAPGILAAIFLRFVPILGILIWLASVGWGFYNAWLNGETGKSFGKQYVGLKVIGETTGTVIGGAQGIVRYIAHIVDGIVCGLGYLLPLVDPKKQTIADKLIKTVVIVDKT